MSQREEPLDLRLVKDSCPGVSIIRKPGISNSKSIFPSSCLNVLIKLLMGNK